MVHLNLHFFDLAKVKIKDALNGQAQVQLIVHLLLPLSYLQSWFKGSFCFDLPVVTVNSKKKVIN